MEEGSVLRHQPLSESNTNRGAFQVDIWALCICLSQSQNGESMFLTCQNYIFEKYIHHFLSRNVFERCIISNFIACFRIMIYVNTIKPSWFVTCNGVGLDVWWWIFTQYSWNTRTGRGGYLPHQRNPVTGGPYQTGPSLMVKIMIITSAWKATIFYCWQPCWGWRSLALMPYFSMMGTLWSLSWEYPRGRRFRRSKCGICVALHYTWMKTSYDNSCHWHSYATDYQSTGVTTGQVPLSSELLP